LRIGGSGAGGGTTRSTLMQCHKAPERFRIGRLLFRRPEAADAEAIFSRYASDPEVCRFLAWLRHRSIEDTRAFIAFSDAEWQRWPAGPFLVFSASDDTLIGSTGLAFESATLASTGYVFARDAWGQGFATASVQAMQGIAAAAGVETLYALCHQEHRASQRVLEKCGFVREAALAACEFPNLRAGVVQDAYRYSLRPVSG